jgi:2-polyprenyl-3-methyl-5-hydroxy-6-metoxy-1,4-benzoquinol methylase
LLQNLHRIDTRRVLDFAAGGGEVTRVLQDAGVSDIEGCDPYTHRLYTRLTGGLPCREMSFMEVIRHGLEGQYSAIICSFAMHLCPEKELFSLCWNLLQAAPQLIIITPHKRPELERLSGFELDWTDFVNTERGKKIRIKAYRRL